MSSAPRNMELLGEPGKAKIHKIIDDRVRIYRVRVYWDSTYWDADIYRHDFDDSILPGQFVTVIGRRSNKLVALIE